MNRDLRRALLKLDDFGFRELELSIQVARKCSDLIVDNNKTVEWFAETMGISLYVAKEFLTGAHAFKVEEIAKIEILTENMEVERNAQQRLH
jgi:hypothetical protein